MAKGSGQSLPHVFAGTVTIDGKPAPDGGVVTAWVEGKLAAVAIVSDNRFSMLVEPPPGSFYSGKTVTFRVGECRAPQSVAWAPGSADTLDLSVFTRP